MSRYHAARPLVEAAVEAWHGTRNLDFKTFSRAFTSGQLGFHFGTEEQATGLLGEDETVPRVIRVELDIENPLRMPDLGGWTGHAAKAEFERALGTKIPGSGSDASIVRAVRAAGHDGVVYANRFEGEGDSYIVFDPSQIRIVGDARTPQSMKSLSARTRGGGKMSYARISKMAQHRHQVVGDVRHPMYELGDKLHALKEVVGAEPVMRDDGALRALLAQVEGARDAVFRHLEQHYLWD